MTRDIKVLLRDHNTEKNHKEWSEVEVGTHKEASKRFIDHPSKFLSA